MANRVTKAEQILRELAQKAKAVVDAATVDLDIARATYIAYYEALARLQKARETAPQKRTKKAATVTPAQKEPTADKVVSDARCVAKVPTLDVPCGEREDSLIHDPKGGYASYHPFEPLKPVARVRRKSKQKSEPTSSDQSSRTVTESVGSAALAASGGGSGD